MTAIFPCSGDPITKAHYNIKEKWSKELSQQVNFCLCQNPLKTEGLLSISQRQKDLIISLLTYQIDSWLIRSKFNIKNKIRDITASIYTPQTREEIYTILDWADYIIRWIRSQEDVDYSLNLLDRIGNPDRIKKWVPIDQDEIYKNVSSTKYKIAYANISEKISSFPKIYSFLDKELIDKKCYERKEWKNINQNESKILENNIMDYFWLVSDLERKWRYKNIIRENI